MKNGILMTEDIMKDTEDIMKDIKDMILIIDEEIEAINTMFIEYENSQSK